ncbi:nitroreductase/quinone reductase family protein [Streptomyces goshikiensis]|uniref:nitroreductase/quinone reductase family protein n=1 Tax=Streptomyces goshikiensis TaxID=1942 RepID=UPI00332B6DCD
MWGRPLSCGPGGRRAPFEGAGLIPLTTPGGQGMYVVGSADGSDRHPDWCRDLLARPLVRVETGTDRGLRGRGGARRGGAAGEARVAPARDPRRGAPAHR